MYLLFSTAPESRFLPLIVPKYAQPDLSLPPDSHQYEDVAHQPDDEGDGVHQQGHHQLLHGDRGGAGVIFIFIVLIVIELIVNT